MGKLNNVVKMGFSTGSADHAISIIGANLSYATGLNVKWGFDTRITFLAQSGNDVAVAGLGDVFANLNYHITSKMTVTAGVKIPLTKADMQLDGKTLPMDYQSSLGTLDLYTGISYRLEKWQWALALQLPLEQNQNDYFPSAFGPGSPLGGFQTTNAFDRKADILLRVSYPVFLNDKIAITPGLLPIYHLGEDEFVSMDGQRMVIPGSDGLTINGTVFVDIKLTTKSALHFNLGFPFLVRDTRPDGLTRGYVMAAEYAWKF
jgi:hypothetical protein